MRVKIYVEGEFLKHFEFPIEDLKEYFNLLKTIELIDGDGSICKVMSIQYDLNQNAFDIGCDFVKS